MSPRANWRGWAVAGSPTLTVVAAATARSTSSRVIRPSRPVPSMRAGSMSCWSSARLTEGERRASASPFARRRPGSQERRQALTAAAPFDSGLRRANGSSAASNPPQQRPRHRLGIRIQHDLAQHPRRRRRHFLRHLVGLQLDQRIVDRDRLADLLEPGADDRLGAFLLVGNADLDHLEPHQPVDLGADLARPTAPPIPAAWDDAGSGCRAWSRARPAHRDRGRLRRRRPRRSPRRSRRCADPHGRSGSGASGGRCPAPCRGPTASGCAGR